MTVLSEIPEAVREWLRFRLFVHVGGGLGDVAHRYVDNAYLRIARHFREVFPRCEMWVYLEGKNTALTRQIFDRDPNIAGVIVAHQRPGDWNWEHVRDFMLERCDRPIEFWASEMPDHDPPVVFRRLVNRVCTLMRFPRFRAISMDDFFQQARLSVEDFAWELPEIHTTAEDEAAADEAMDVAGMTGRDILVLHAHTADESRAIYPKASWRGLATEAVRRGFAVVVFGGPDDFDIFSEGMRKQRLVDATRDGELGYKVALLKRATGAICIDGGLMSLAWLHAIPTVTLLSADKMRLTCNQQPAGYHWAAAAGEPFAVRRVLTGRPKDDGPSAVLDVVQSIRSTKGKRGTQLWGPA
jgi:hypothetical protein